MVNPDSRQENHITFNDPNLRPGGGGEAHRVQDVRVHRGGERRLDQVHPVSRPSASGQIVATRYNNFSLFSFFAFAWCVA